MRKKLYFLSLVIFLLSVGLVFNDNLWFDESYTLALIKHSYSDMIRILRSDMHPPLYFICLKAFADCFGHSIIMTKIFSSFGLLLTLILGCSLVRKDFGEKVALLYILIVAAVPMMFYFSVQQRCYAWCIFWVTLCFIIGFRMMNRESVKDAVVFAITFLFSAYNHTYALVAVVGIAVFINFFMFFLKKSICNIILADIVILLGYLPWFSILLLQARNAVSEFWLTSLEPLSLVVFILSSLLFVAMLWKKQNRRKCVLYGVFSIIFVHFVGLGISIIIRPMYIARYAVPLLGIFALILAICFERVVHQKKVIVLLSCIIVLQYIGIVCFEYSPSISEFRNEFAQEKEDEDVFLYTDSSFGVMSYYYPENTHVCFTYQSWFQAYENVQFVDKDSLPCQKSDLKFWYVVDQNHEIPDWMKQKWAMTKKYSFQNDFNCFDVYLLCEEINTSVFVDKEKAGNTG